MLQATDLTKRLFTKENSVKVAAEMQAGDEDWTYAPEHDPKGTGYSFIKIYDEEGYFIGCVC